MSAVKNLFMNLYMDNRKSFLEDEGLDPYEMAREAWEASEGFLETEMDSHFPDWPEMNEDELEDLILDEKKVWDYFIHCIQY